MLAPGRTLVAVCAPFAITPPREPFDPLHVRPLRTSRPGSAMNGIGGLFGLDGAVPAAARATNLSTALAQRGGAGGGRYDGGALVLLHRGQPADQPFVDPRGAMLGPLVARQDCMRELCLPGTVERLFAKIEHKRHVLAAWTLLFYALWYRAHIARLAPERDVFQTLSSHG